VHAGYYRTGMKRSSRAWILLPAIIVAIVVIGLVVSNFQKEAGLAQPSKGGIAAVAAAAAGFGADPNTRSPDPG